MITPPPGPSIVEEYWGGVVHRLQTEVGVFNRLIGHQAEMGRENELSLSRLLEALLPADLGVGTGIVIDKHNGRSKQCDLIVYDRAHQPSIMAQTNQTLFPVEVVKIVIEVKTTLSPAQLEDCGKKRLALAALSPADTFLPPSFFILSYAHSASPDALASSLYAMDPGSRPDGLCVISPGVLWRGGNAQSCNFVYLHETDERGGRKSGSPVALASVPAGARMLRGGTYFPITRIGTQYLAGDPGRCLLLFCEDLLQALSQAATSGPYILTHYINQMAQESLTLPASENPS